MRVLVMALLVAIAHVSLCAQEADWSANGRDAQGTRYSPAAEITRKNVTHLAVAWTYRTGETVPRFKTKKATAFEATPLVVEGTMYVGTPLVSVRQPRSHGQLSRSDQRVPCGRRLRAGYRGAPPPGAHQTRCGAESLAGGRGCAAVRPRGRQRWACGVVRVHRGGRVGPDRGRPDWAILEARSGPD